MKGQITITFLIFFTFAIILFGLLLSASYKSAKKMKGYAEVIKLKFERKYNSLDAYVRNRVTQDHVFCDEYMSDCLTRHHYG